MKTAFVVLTYNRVDALLCVLRALAPQCGPEDVVVIADDGSRPQQVDAMRKGLPAFPCPVRHVWHPDEGFTASRARNLGALHARADYLVFMDGDCVPRPQFVRAHRQLAQPGHFVNGSRVLLDEPLTRRIERREVDLCALGTVDWLKLRVNGHVNKLTHLLYWGSDVGRVERQFRWKGIRSCNFGVWQDDFHAVNGFDETFKGWGHEDADLVLRLHHQGCLRKNGFMATEVFHLWHRENDRGQEAGNRDRVHERAQGRITRAEVGLDHAGGDGAAVITELN